jgi:hypothetical protein|tara:strand:- start:142 stop:831 length:690 start_codon:yes stop_codon:yes gene_type:complete
MPNPLVGLTKVDNSDIVDSAVVGTKVVTSQPLNIFSGVPGSSADLLAGDGTFQTNTNNVDGVGINDTNAFNIGLLGFKHAVNEGLTIFNLVDGIVDEFHDESGVDTSENANANYDATNDLYSNPTTTMTVISDTFTAQTVPTKARIVVFAELPDGTGDFVVSATRDNSTFNAITLTDEGFQAGSSGLKIFSGSATLTGTGSPQVALRWKVVGSGLSGTNKIHGVALQWA